MDIDKLELIREKAKSGNLADTTTPRELLALVGAKRRSYWNNIEVRKILEERNLATVPDFELAYIDSVLEFRVLKSGAQDETVTAVDVATHVSTENEETVEAIIRRDPSYRVSRLAAANQNVTSVKPDGTLAEAITIMLSQGFSQLPVMTTPREVKGIISWRTIGTKLGFQDAGTLVREHMEPHQEVRIFSSIFDIIPIIDVHDYVLVRNDENLITGIVTATDLAIQFKVLTEPFLLISEIENQVRELINRGFSIEELRAAKDPGDSGREVRSVADLTFGEYIRLLENDERWTKLGVRLDRQYFCRQLAEVRDIRNDVMHFDPDGTNDDQTQKLRKFANLMSQIRQHIKR